ncbi:MAG: GntR family transcriptional regulator [Bacteroidales bacterium]|nr:GntR family transcriptional regulator [Bacteroidales bacterium]MDD3908137.1 GntR family transcriptional regulator [Bacteroidales bacterium]
MDFNENKAIYLQIADILCEQILDGEWPPQEKIPSVREMGITLQVNPNTVLRTYDFLQQKNIIFNKRGLGYFVEEDAVKKILEIRRDNFLKNTLPNFFKTISLLQILPEEIMEKYQEYLLKTPKSTVFTNK